MFRRIRNAVVLAGALALTAVPSLAQADSGPFQNDPMGRLRDVTEHWRHYQPAGRFCVKPDSRTYTPGGNGVDATGKDKACRRSGFSRHAKGLVKVHIRTPELCTGCRRFFIAFSKIPKTTAAGDGHAQGHAYYHLSSPNNTYTVDAKAHSPNTKNFTNDKLVAPHGSPQEQLIGAWDLHAIEYVTDTRNFIHTGSQGRYYIGPTYLNRNHEWVNGVYLDVNVADATQLPTGQLNAIGYVAGFNSGTVCPTDDDTFYAGCFDWWGMSSNTIDPFADN